MDARRLADEAGFGHRMERSEAGYTLFRRAGDDADRFTNVVRRILDEAGPDYVALPRTDGLGYDGVVIIPLD